MPRIIHLAPGGWLAPTTNLRFRSFLAPATIGFLLALLLAASPARADGGAVMNIVAEGEYFYCGSSMDVTFSYTPDLVATPILRAYSIRIVAPYGLTFAAADITVNSPLAGVKDTHFIIEHAEGDCTIDFTFLDPGTGLTDPADLFIIAMRDLGFNFPNTPVGIEDARLRNLGNLDITVDTSETVLVDIRCISPTAPTIDSEPEYSPGTTNTLTWSDESWAGAVDYNIQMSTDPGFATIDDESGWITGLSHEFTGLVGGQQYYFKARARNFTGKLSADSNVEQTMQDANPPTTSCDPLDPDQFVEDFDVPFQAADDISGFGDLVLFYRFDGGAWTEYETASVSPVAFTATDGDGLYEFYTVGTDVAGNVENTPAGPQASTTLDTSEPYGSFTINGGAVATNDPNVTLIVSVIRADDMRFSNTGAFGPGGWISLAGVHPWTIPASEGPHTVYAQFRDASLNVLEVSQDIEFDITPPGSVTSPAIAPGHETVLLSWTNPGDPDFHRVEVWRGLMHDGSNGSTYPSYIGSTIPTPPADRAAALASAEWVLAGLSEIGAATFTDAVIDRGVYYYEFFAIDPANNYSPPEGSTPRATNYQLGDVASPHDGSVRIDDKTLLGSTYGLTAFNPLFIGICDVGPTDDGLSTGIPEPDDQINQEDSMIFGMIFPPSAQSLGNDGESPPFSGPVSLSWRPQGELSWTLDLTAPCPGLKGIGISAALPEGVVPVVSPGEAVVNQADPFFLANIDPHGLDASLVIFGAGRGMSATGTLLTVTLPAGGTALDLREIDLDLRDVNNKPLAYDLQGKSGALPASVFSLEGAHPNPFNPVTTIRFSIPGEMPVRLEVYGLDGRRVAVLVDETLAPGAHEAVWLGRDDTGRPAASGVYFSRLLAGSLSQVRKMTLMK